MYFLVNLTRNNNCNLAKKARRLEGKKALISRAAASKLKKSRTILFYNTETTLLLKARSTLPFFFASTKSNSQKV